jgi:predicted short-subunit dehydrogenase-like oxidoreductase (DUF2520 family)
MATANKFKHSLAIIGPGRVGISIAAAASNAGYSVVLGARNTANPQALASLARLASNSSCAGKIKLLTIEEAAAQAEIVLLTVSDDSVQSLCEELSQTKSFVDGSVVAHTSGTLPSSVLEFAKKTSNCTIASAHPLQTFACVESSYKNLPDTHWFLEGDDPAIELLSKLITDLSGKPHTITSEQKALYHAACAVASNYLTTTIDIALKLMEKARINNNDALDALKPLIKSAVANSLATDPQQALTGPISRGDATTIQAHIRALADYAPTYSDFYKAVGRHTVELALHKASINDVQAAELLAILDS